MRKPLLVSALVVGPVVGSAMLLFLTSPTTVTVLNNSSQTITAISVEVQGKALGFASIPAGRSARRWFLNSGSDGYPLLEARTSDGRAIRRLGGYITSGSLGGVIEFTITPEFDVELFEKYWP